MGRRAGRRLARERDMKKPRDLSRGYSFGVIRPSMLPEEVIDHVHNFAAVDIDQQNVVIVSYPAIGAVHLW